MACCPVNIIPFSNQLTTTIDYNAGLKAEFGNYPKVSLYYFDSSTGDFYEVNGVPGTEVKFDGDNIIVDHGGPATGLLKIS